MKSLLTILYSCLFLTISGAQETGIAWIDNDFDQAFKHASKSGKMVFLYAYTTWCGPCKAMKKSVFPNEDVGAFYNEKFVNVKMDMEKGEGFEVGDKYQITGYPTLLFLNSSGDVIHRTMGGRKVLEFLELGNSALDPEQQISTLHKRYASGENDPSFLKQYTKVISESEFSGFEPISQQYLDTQDDWTTSDNMKFIFDYSEADIKSPLFQYTLKNKEAFIALLGAEKYKSKIAFAAERDRAKEGIPRDDVERLKIHYRRYFSKDEAYNQAMQTYFKQLMYSPDPVEQETFKTEIQLFLADTPDLSWNFYNAAAWQLFEITTERDLLRKAANWSLISISKKENSHNTDTMAFILHKLGDNESAKSYAHRSIELAKKDGADYSETEKLLQKL